MNRYEYTAQKCCKDGDKLTMRRMIWKGVRNTKQSGLWLIESQKTIRKLIVTKLYTFINK